MSPSRLVVLSPRKRVLFGLRSTIRRDIRPHAAIEAARKHHKELRDRAAADAAAPISKGRTRIRYRDGKRKRRDNPLTANNLYLDDARPRADAPLAGHKCVICECVKSHPVAYVSSFLPFISDEHGYRYKCGHSYCYVCIRLRLEENWSCPHKDCNRIMRRAPKVDVGEAESVAADYPDCVDKSTVSYSWDGLDFPYPPRSIFVSSSP
jgi:hypothetical protein